jgi:hypothetical protein
MEARVLRRLKDVRTWILLFAAIRLIGITDPPLDMAHNWRQATVLMVARNYHEQGMDLLHPRIDFAGERTGITGMEFPLLNAGTAIVGEVFGWTDWYGRVIVLLLSLLGVWSFHQLVQRELDARVALIASLLLLSSLWFQYGRKTMPDVFALSLVMYGAWSASRLLDGERPLLHGILAFFGIALGVLSKSPAALMLVALVPSCWRARHHRQRVVALAVITAGALLPAAWWYGVWVPHLERAYGFHHFFMGKSMLQGARELIMHGPAVAEKFYFDALRFTGALAFLWGLIVLVRERRKGMLGVTALFFLTFALLMLMAGSTFAIHSYYILPIVPIMAVVAAMGLAALPSPKATWLLTASIVVEGVANGQHDLFLKPSQRTLLALEPLLDEHSKKDDRIVINGGDVPTAMYFAHRKGWIARNADLSRPDFIDSLATLGCRTIVVQKRRDEKDVSIDRPVVAETEDFRILRTDGP